MPSDQRTAAASGRCADGPSDRRAAAPSDRRVNAAAAAPARPTPAYVRPDVAPYAGAPGVFSADDAQAYARARYGAAAHGLQAGNASRRRAGAKSPFWTAVLVIALLVLAASIGLLGVIGYGYWHGSKVYDDIAQQAFPAKEADALASFTIDWDALVAQNPDTVGWIYMPGTSIDYPIVQGDTDEEYLEKDFTGDAGGLVHKGAIFLSAENAGDMSDQNNFIYGHNMNDDTMFAHVLQMADQQAFDAARTFYVFTPARNYRCSTYALDVVDATETSILQFGFASHDDLSAYMAQRMEASRVAVPADADTASAEKLFTLITCGDDYAATRAVLFGSVVESAVPANAPASGA